MLLWIEGFEEFGTTDANLRASIAFKYTTNAVTLSKNMTGRAVGRAIGLLESGAGFITTPNLGNIGTICVGFAFRVESTLATLPIMQLREADDATNGFNLRLNSDGSLQVYNNTSSIATSSAGLISPDTWYYIEAKVLVANSGTYDIQLDGASILSGSADTQQGASAFCNRVRLLGSDNLTRVFIFDDWYVLDTTSAANNDLLGDRRVLTVFPTGAGSETDFTPSAGNNWAAVDDNPPDGDTTYVESAVSTDTDLYGFADVSDLASINGVQINAIARKTAGDFNLALPVLSNVTQSDGSAVAVTSSFANYHRIVEEDPDATDPWTESTLNAAEFGVKVG